MDKKAMTPWRKEGVQATIKWEDEDVSS